MSPRNLKHKTFEGELHTDIDFLFLFHRLAQENKPTYVPVTKFHKIRNSFKEMYEVRPNSFNGGGTITLALKQRIRERVYDTES